MNIKIGKIGGEFSLFYPWSALLVILVIGGVYATIEISLHGMFLSGLSNRIPWGIHTILTDYYLGISVGCLAFAAIFGIFGATRFKSSVRIAAYLTPMFMIAALLSLLIDQGRMVLVLVKSFTHFNADSLFSMNLLVGVTLAIICCLLIYALSRNKEKLANIISLVGALCVMALYGAVGQLFGLLPRDLYHSWLGPPIFITAAMASGVAVVLIAVIAVSRLSKREVDPAPLNQIGYVLAFALAAFFCFTAIETIIRICRTESREASLFLLFGGFHSVILWIGWFAAGCILPAFILFRRRIGVSAILLASLLVLLGVFCEHWLRILPGLMFPPNLFPGWEIITDNSMAPDGIAGYTIRFAELLQVLGILGLIGLLFLRGRRFMQR